MEIELDARFLETLEDISWAQNPPHVLNVPCKRPEERIYISGGRRGSTETPTIFRPFDYIIRDYMDTFARVL